MIRSLALVAIGGALISMICIGASGALSRKGWHVPAVGWDVGADGAGGPVEVLTGHEPTLTRDLPWTGGESLTFDLPAAVTYTQGPVVKVTVSGPDVLVKNVAMDGSEMRLERPVHNLSTEHPLRIVITAPGVHEFVAYSALTLDLRELSTDRLRVELNGAGKVSAAGSARTVSLEMNGAGDAELSGLTTTDGTFEINGIGHVTAGPTGTAKVELNGAGSVRLTKRPRQLQQEINGAGRVSQPDAPPGQAL